MTGEETNEPVPGSSHSLIWLLQVILYIPIQIAFLPFALIGLIDGVYGEARIGRKMGVSFSARARVNRCVNVSGGFLPLTV
jgi:hypothetical protein